MIITILINELRHNILSLRLHLTLMLSVILFGIGTVAYVINQKTANEEYREYEAKNNETLRKQIESNLSQFATNRQSYLMPSRDDSFIDDAREKYMPNSFTFNAYNVFGYAVSPGSVNPLLKQSEELSWTYIISIIIGFAVLLMTFDTVSGEKETRTLAMMFANPVSRGTILFGKYLSVIATTILVIFPGIAISLIIVFASGTVPLTPAVLVETAEFLLAMTVFTACMAAFGLLASTLTRTAGVSLLIVIAFWLLFVVIVPNTALFWGQTLFPIEPAQSVSERTSKARNDINKNAPQGSWSSSSNNPFLPQHELRAANQTKLMLSDKHIRDAWYLEMFRQLRQTRIATFFSPVSLFQYTSEAVVGGGYLRFEKNWDDLHIYQERLLSFFKSKDALDTESPHWYNPYEDYSTTKKPANFSETPVYTETRLSFTERMQKASFYMLIMLVITTAVLGSTFVLFLRYDVR